MPELDPRRADLSPVGAVLVDTLLEGLGAEEMTLCDFALREGLVLDYIQRNAAHIRKVERYPDVRRRSIIELGRAVQLPARARAAGRAARAPALRRDARSARAGGSRTGMARVRRRSCTTSASTSATRGTTSTRTTSSGTAACAASSRRRSTVIGLVARYHRQGTPKKSHEGFGDLPRRREAVRVLGAIVRLAEGLDRSHAQVIDRVSVRDR